LVRQRRSEEALEHLQQALELMPDDPRFAFTLGLALQSRSPERALSTVKKAVEKHPHDPDLLWLSGVYSLAQGSPIAAVEYAERLLVVSPGSQKAMDLLQHAKSQIAGD
jgi:Flp pilus assembly protein TadD